MEKVKVSKAQQKAVHKYVKINYDRIDVTVKKGALNGFINRAIFEAIERDDMVN